MKKNTRGHNNHVNLHSSAMMKAENLAADLTHDDGAFDGELAVAPAAAHRANDPLHPVYLLLEEDVHGARGSHLQQSGFHLHHTTTTQHTAPGERTPRGWTVETVEAWLSLSMCGGGVDISEHVQWRRGYL